MNQPLFDRRRFLVRTGGITSAGIAGALSDSTSASAAPRKGNRMSANASTLHSPADLKAADFSKHVDEKFTTKGERYQVTLILKEVREIRLPNDPNRPKQLRKDPYSLLFHARNFNDLEPGIYRLKNSRFGEIDLYLQKVRADDDPATVHYEAVIN